MPSELGSDKPLLVLAFANEEGRFLERLHDELRRTRAALAKAVDAGWCERPLELFAATAEEVYAQFSRRRHRDRIAVFHYGGHAGAGQLLFECAQGGNAATGGGGLATFLGEQRGLELVFLNGCHTVELVDELLDAGVNAVIATWESVDDALACELAVAFYEQLAGGVELQRAFAEAEGRVRGHHGAAWETPRSFDPAGSKRRRDSPWELFLRPAAQDTLEWSLPAAASDPLFGLPALPELDLPAEPYRHLAWFHREHAELFFGRGAKIRELYRAVTAPERRPIVCFVGATGVGKSSLLHAGLLPRLEHAQQVRYVRRDDGLGLVGSLRRALGAEGGAGELAAAWRAIERTSGRPFTVVLDQVEEAFVRAGVPGELEAFGEVLRALFSTRNRRPAGRLVLGFRKEWLQEVLATLRRLKLPAARVDLERMTRDEVIEAVEGVQRTARLREAYRIELDPPLAGIIADDLLADPGSPTAPTLQILLTKLWRRAEQLDPGGAKRFNVKDYQRLERDGIFLGDFVDQQLARLREWRTEFVDSGLALDLLAFHTTGLGAAASREAETVRRRYAHRADDVANALRRLQDLYLLVEDDGAEGGPRDRTRLAHDTLGRIVLERFRRSLLPGQRARRILEQRAVGWGAARAADPAEQGRAGLGDAGLAEVEQGLSGMRAPTEAEARLVEVSQARRERRRAEADAARRRAEELQAESERQRLARERLARRAAWGASAAAVVLLALVGYSVRERQKAERSAAEARVEKFRTEVTLETVRLQEVWQLWAGRGQDEPESVEEAAVAVLSSAIALQGRRPEAGAALAPATLQSLQAATSELAAVVSSSRVAQAEALQRARAVRLSWSSAPGSQRALACAWSPDGERVLAGFADGTLRVWDLKAGKVVWERDAHSQAVTCCAWNPRGTWIVSGSEDTSLKLWKADSGELVEELEEHDQAVTACAWSPDGKSLLSASRDGVLVTWSEVAGALRTVRTVQARGGAALCCAWSPDGGRVLAGSADGRLRVWRVDTERPLFALEGHRGQVLACGWSADGGRILSGSTDTKLMLWDAQRGELLRTLEGHAQGVRSCAWGPDGLRAVSGSEDTSLKVWDVESGELLRTLGGHTGWINACAWSPDGGLLSAAGDTTIKLWQTTFSEVTNVEAHTGGVSSVALAEGGFLSGSQDGTLLRWQEGEAAPVSSWSHPSPLLGVATEPGGTRVVAAYRDKTLRVWGAGGDPGIPLQGHQDEVWSCAWSPDGARIASGSADATLRLWDAARLRPLRDLRGHRAGVRCCAWQGPQGTLLVSGSEDTTLKIWDAARGTCLRTLAGHEAPVGSCAWSPDGERIVSGAEDTTLRVWNAASGEVIRTLEGHEGAVRCCAWSPDGARILSGSDDRTLRVWDAQSGALLRTLRGHTKQVLSCAWFPGGARILSGGQDRALKVWPYLSQ